MRDSIHPPLLSVSDLTMHFGGILALNEVSFEVNRRSITAIIGPNGAGKTTLFNCLTGFYRPHDGNIFLLQSRKGELDLTQLLGQPFQLTDFINPLAFSRRLYYKLFGGSHLTARIGIARTFQNIRLFRQMTVMENLLIAQHHALNRNVLAGLFQTTAYQAAEQDAIARAHAWLKVFKLEVFANRLAGELPYGSQRRLEIARAMCTRPRLLCLDEPAAGLNPKETAELSELIRRLRDDYEVTILLIEHDMSLVMQISEHIVVLDHGEVIADGSPEEVKHDAAVLAAYLGFSG